MEPMTSATIEKLDDLKGKYPLYASPKLDGIRAIVKDGIVYSRNGKPIANQYVQAAMPLARMNGWDGELIVGKPYAPDCFRRTTSGVMSVEGKPEFTFYVFDYVPPAMNMPYVDRWRGLKQNCRTPFSEKVKLVPQIEIKNSLDLYRYEKEMIEKGFEGVMLRSPQGLYKPGRSTMKEGYLMKLKKFADGEAEVIGFVEQMHNTNEATRNAHGKLERSSHKAGKVGKGVLGALQVRDCVTGVEFEVGTGFNDLQRLGMWKQQKYWLGKIIKYKHFPQGSKDKPRFPVFIGERKD